MTKPYAYTISAEQAKELKQYRKTVKDKQTDKRLWAVQLRGEGKDNTEIGEMLETSSDMVSRWVSAYAKQGIEALLPKKRPGRPPNISYADEEALLSEYKEQAEQGTMVEVSAIKAAYEKKVGHRIGGSQIYYVLDRHGWRKVMPRSKHPKKASEEVIEASKKLTLNSKN